MTVKELKEELNKFDDNLIVMIPRTEPAPDDWLGFVSAKNVSQGVNEADGCLFIDDYVEQDCDTCAYYDTDKSDQPCCGCVDWENWESEVQK